MDKLWDFECVTCGTREEFMAADGVLSVQCACGSQMIRVMGGRPSAGAPDRRSGCPVHPHGHAIELPLPRGARIVALGVLERRRKGDKGDA